jgi:GR25 family glycosyltransferase involved in LPS biosynthesis
MHAPQFDARRLRILVALLLSAGALAGITPVVASASTVVASASTVEASASTCVGWTGVQPPSPGTDSNSLLGVAVVSPCNAWAVGDYYNGTADQTLIEHWNGTSWKQVTSPNPGGSSHTNVLDAVAATSSTNAWAVGYYSNGTADQTLIEHWNGTAWKQVTSPNPGGSSNDNSLYGVAATSSANAWAVGGYYNGTAKQTLIEHWNGTAWKQVTSPNPGGSSHYNILNGVAATSSTNAWAVGDYSNGTENRTLIEHWNGAAWKQVTSPNAGGSSEGNFLYGVAATSSTNAWAVGYFYNATAYQTLIEHWNGTAWKQVTSPNPGGSAGNFLDAVAATSSTNAWAVGDYSNGTAEQTLIEHWNGTAWKQVTSPNPGGSADSNALDAVAATSSTNAWAVGYYFNGTAYRTLATHCC